jgi:hypothetical protein
MVVFISILRRFEVKGVGKINGVEIFNWTRHMYVLEDITWHDCIPESKP